uniref:asparagine--tRNA ligase n=1 Tax=Araucaria cunninghamii TaxID=56994 RepID=A0A0D6QUQ7_ARACU
MEERAKVKPGLPHKDGKVDYSRDFFSRQAFLTVSGQFHVESYACALSSVYTFGPTFRAEESQNTRHLAEYWMVEPEIAFADLEDAMNCAEDLLKFLSQWLLDNCVDDMKFMANQFDKTIFDRLRLIASTPFARITYTEAVDLLKKVPKFENRIEWGMNLTSEQERCLTEDILKKAVIVYNHPKEVRSFYMRLNDDGKTVASMDVLVPKAGGLVHGSQREERCEILEKRIQELGLPREPYEWYLDLRRYGTIKHSGFGLGFECMVFFSTGLEHINDVVPFPRQRGKIDV